MRQIDSKKGMVKFFEDNLIAGRDAEELYTVLLNQGYLKSMINAGYNEAMSNIHKKKQAQAELSAPPKIEVVTNSKEEKKIGFFSKLKKRFDKE